MIPEQKIQNVAVVADRCQYEVANLKARVDALCEQMNKFCADVQGQIVELLQRQGQDIKITDVGDTSPNIPDEWGTSPLIIEGEKN